MKRVTQFLLLTGGTMALLGFAGIIKGTNDKGKSSSCLEQLVPLVGEWEGTSGNNGPTKLTYTLVSNGSALMERLQPSNEPEMITMYTAEGDRLLVTHYCSAGNQPQMQTAPITGPTRKFDFAVVRVSGMKSTSEGHMVRLVLTLTDKDHLIQEWTFLENGKEQKDVFRYTRKS